MNRGKQASEETNSTEGEKEAQHSEFQSHGKAG